jgi:PDGLE domain
MRRGTWVVIGVGLVVALVAAGFLSFYASSAPDGLQKVAADQGFVGTAQDSATSGLPTAGYGIEGVADDRLSGGLAGVLGVLVMIVLGFGLFWLLGRGRKTAQADDRTQAGT